jgi:hypothetical protein
MKNSPLVAAVQRHSLTPQHEQPQAVLVTLVGCSQLFKRSQLLSLSSDLVLYRQSEDMGSTLDRTTVYRSREILCEVLGALVRFRGNV